MKVWCSECLCIAIESHRSALLKSLLQRSDDQYSDIFRAPTLSPNSWQFIDDIYNFKFPLLHDMGPDMDMSIVWRDDCGHMQVEVEFCDPSDLLNKQRAWILVSLPMIARWHTSERFNTERILRQSGKFDYSEPQFFDVLFINSNSKLNLPGPLIVHPSIEIVWIWDEKCIEPCATRFQYTGYYSQRVVHSAMSQGYYSGAYNVTSWNVVH